MEIKINGTPKEIAELTLELQDRLSTYEEVNSDVLAKNVMKGIKAIEAQHSKSDKADYASAQKAITEVAKKIHKCTVDEKGISYRTVNED